MTLDRLKEAARKHEQRQEWRRAIEVYLKAIEEFESGREPVPDLTIYNRVGDLHAKLGENDAALRAYERAAELYADQGFLNNAIALCGKILRLAPDRVQTMLQLAHLNARKGVMVAAKQHLLDYLDRMSAQRRLDEAFKQVAAFADEFPGNPAVRLMLSELLQAAARTDEAREQIEKLSLDLGMRAEARTEAVSPVRPMPPPPATPMDPLGSKSRDLIFLDTGVFDAETARGSASPVDAPPVPRLEGIEVTELAPPVEPVNPTEGLVVEAAMRGADETEGLPGYEPTSAAPGDGLTPETVAPLDGLERAPDQVELKGAVADVDVMAEITRSVETPKAGPGTGLEIIPPGAPPLPTIRALQNQVLDDPSSPDSHFALGRALLAIGEDEAGLQELALALSGYQARENWSAALTAAEALVEHGGGLAQHRLRVELAHRVGDRSRVVEAMLALGGALKAAGERDRAASVFGGVLELDPDNALAQVALAGLRPSAEAAPPPSDRLAAPTAAPSVPPASSIPTTGDGFVDLGSLVLGDEAPTDSRMKADRGEPETDDEEKEFREILQLFKRGVELNIGAEDFQAHYDLGIAYREMGLLDEAIAEFQKALRDPEGRLKTAEALGRCFFDRDQFKIAEAVFRRALETAPGGAQETVAVWYWLGRALEAQERVEQALDCYERALALDIRFMDLADRIQRLSAGRRG
ncbi:MAG: tetratricopeptide repeat protein [Gemmatimonadota bacterium]